MSKMADLRKTLLPQASQAESMGRRLLRVNERLWGAERSCNVQTEQFLGPVIISTTAFGALNNMGDTS
jgi:hypothetical protein